MFADQVHRRQIGGDESEEFEVIDLHANLPTAQLRPAVLELAVRPCQAGTGPDG